MKWNQLKYRLPGPLHGRPWLLIPLLIVVAAVALLAWPKASKTATAFYQAKRGDLTITVIDRGTLSAVREVSVRSEVEGTARIIYIVPEGTYVKKGDLLVELDSSQAQDQVNQQQINFEKARFALAQAEAQLEIQRSSTNSDIRAAELKVYFANMDLLKFDEGQSWVDLVESSNKVVQSLAQLSVNRDNYTWTTNLAKKGYETKQKVDSDRLAVLNNENSLIVASNTLLMLRKFDLPKQREKFQSDYEEAKKELERVILQSERKIAQYQADLLSQSNTLALNEKKLERDRKNLHGTRLLAPQDGLVVYAMSENRFSSESLIEEGAVVRNRQELIKLPDTSAMKVTIKVHESHVGLVQAGQPAFVKLDSMPDQRFRGVVQKVALLPDSQARFGNPNLKVYNTEVLITDPLPGVKPGVSAQAEIIVTNLENTLSVPLQAVTTLKGRQVVYVSQGSKNVPVPVKVGMFNTKFIEIASGLNEGDRVLLSPPFDTQEEDLEGAVLAAEEKAKLATNTAAIKEAAKRAASIQEMNGNGPGGQPEDSRPNRNALAGGPRPGTEPGNQATPASPLKEVDKDGDSELNQTDRDSRRLAMRERAPGTENAPRMPGNRPAAGAPPGFNPEELVKQYDTNGDGELDETERQALQAAMRARFGSGGQGGGRGNREEMVKRFDKNGDGELDEQERAAMRESFGGRGERGARGNRGEGRQRAAGMTNAEPSPASRELSAPAE